MSIASPLIDLHSHILPGVDHGSSGITESKAQWEIIQKAGVGTIVATPHFYPNQISIGDFRRLVNSAAEEMTEIAVAPPRLVLGAEVLICDGIHHMEGLEQLCIRGTDMLLLELPLSQWSPSLFHTVRELIKRYTVVLAHIDRYVSKQKDELLMMVEQGALAQINVHSLSSFRTRHMLAPFLNSEAVVALGSDLHGAQKDAYAPFFGAEKRLGDKFTAIMERSAALLREAQYLN